MLLSFGAAADVANKQGIRPYDMVEWDRRDAGAASAQQAPATDHSVYCATGRVAERRWGLPDGLRVEQCSYRLGAEEESNSAGQSDMERIRLGG